MEQIGARGDLKGRDEGERLCTHSDDCLQAGAQLQEGPSGDGLRRWAEGVG